MKKIILKQEGNRIFLLMDDEVITFFDNKTTSDVTKWIHKNLKNCCVIGGISG